MQGADQRGSLQQRGSLARSQRRTDHKRPVFATAPMAYSVAERPRAAAALVLKNVTPGCTGEGITAVRTCVGMALVYL